MESRKARSAAYRVRKATKQEIRSRKATKQKIRSRKIESREGGNLTHDRFKRIRYRPGI